jgi:hypothetical protein
VDQLFRFRGLGQDGGVARSAICPTSHDVAKDGALTPSAFAAAQWLKWQTEAWTTARWLLARLLRLDRVKPNRTSG